MLKPICERLTYAQLYGYTDQGRRDRARSVRGPALEIESMPSNQAYHFNFRAYPSTEGKRHQGYVKFFKPKDPKTPLHQLECEVDCDCADLKWRWAHALKQRGSGRVGPTSLNKAWNKAPRITNPSNKVSICKHLCRVRDYIVNMLYGGKTADQLGRLVTLTRTPVVLGGKRVDQSKQPSTKLPVKKPAAPAPAKPTPPARIRVGRTESVVSSVNHNHDYQDWARLFEDDTAPGGIVTNDSEKLDKLLSVVTELVTKIEALAADETAPAGEEGDALPDGAIELDLATGEPKPGEPELEIVGGEDKDGKCPPCDVDGMVPEAPDVADLEDEAEVEVEGAQPEDDLDVDELEKSGKVKSVKVKPAPRGEDEELDGEDEEGGKDED